MHDPDASPPVRPLEGVRVFELGIAIASPHCGRYLAHFGAEVLKVESRTSPDVVRLLGSAWLRDDGERAAAWEDSSPYVPEMNADKRSVGLDLKRPEAIDAAKRLIARCDVFLANFGARALADLGLDYAGVAEVKESGGRIAFTHTEVFQEFRGGPAASTLADEALDGVLRGTR